jgi:hypothetical protein
MMMWWFEMNGWIFSDVIMIVSLMWCCHRKISTLVQYNLAEQESHSELYVQLLSKRLDSIYEDIMEWNDCHILTWRHEDMKTWRHAHLQIWRYANLQIWRYEDLKRWKHDDFTQWKDCDYDRIKEINIWTNWRIMKKNKI